VTSDPRGVVLFGATGFTGRIIARGLASRGIPFTIAAREESRGRALRDELDPSPSLVLADVMDAAQVARAIEGATVVIGCVGPYNLFGGRLLDECRRRDLVYLDLSGEQEFVRRSLDGPAAQGGPGTILHSIAFESTLADLIAAGMLRRDATYRSISSYYAFRRSRPSPGTYLTMRSSRHFPTYRLARGSLVRAEPLSFQEPVPFEPPDGASAAVFMPYPEVLFFRDGYRTAEACSYLLMTPAEAGLARATRSGPVPDLATLLEQHAGHRRKGPVEGERGDQAFNLTVQAVDPDGTRHTHRVSGRDMYGISAHLLLHVVEACVRGQALPEGTLAPSAIPVWDGIWDRLREAGLVDPPSGPGP
jgi:short subunit dehydrogenase-like uncharacterized protein